MSARFGGPRFVIRGSGFSGVASHVRQVCPSHGSHLAVGTRLAGGIFRRIFWDRRYRRIPTTAEGYSGPHVGFYGGIDYGFGYFGSGFVGGYWRDHEFYYNRAESNVANLNTTNIYNRVINKI